MGVGVVVGCGTCVLAPRVGRSLITGAVFVGAVLIAAGGCGTRDGTYPGDVLGVLVYPGFGRGTRDGMVVGAGVVTTVPFGWGMSRGASSAMVAGVAAFGGYGIARDGRFIESVVIGAEPGPVIGVEGRPGLPNSGAVARFGVATGGFVLVTTGRVAITGGAAVGRPGPMVLSRVGRTGSVLTTAAPVSDCRVIGTTPVRVGRD
ncbi:MAG: hypothetical protein ACXVZX_14440 [Terriglobales bacterium]